MSDSKKPMKWALASRAVVLGQSIWNELDEIVDKYDDIIYFGSGSPARELYPAERMRYGANRAWDEALSSLDYGELYGYQPLRDWIGNRMAPCGVTADRVLVLPGSQLGMDLVAKLMIDPGDTIVVEGPTYIGAMQAFDLFQPEYITAPVDEHGMDVAALAAKLDRAERMPKFIYTIPTFQNPTGNTMTLARREALLALARERGILVLEDDPYGEIYFDNPPERPLVAMDPENVIYLGTFSKTIAPGVRMGWLVAPEDLIDPLAMAYEAGDIHGDRIGMRSMYYTVDGFIDPHIVKARAVYRARRDALLRCLEERMPAGVTWSHPAGGFFVWVMLPEGYHAEAFLPLAASRGVAFLPGAYFYPRGQEVRNALRLNFSTVSPENIDEGTRRLGTALAEFLAKGAQA